MKAGWREVCGLVCLAATGAAECRAHFHILLPQAPPIKRGETVEITYHWGHPFEHQMLDAAPPRNWFMLAPDGTKVDLLPSTQKVTGNQQRIAFRASFAPKLRGDYTCVLQSPPIWMEEDGEFLQDTVKLVLHVQAQKGWDAATGQPFDLMPLTRPYGLLPGMVFQAQARVDGKPLAGSLVEIERYNQSPPKELPPDEHITRTAKTDPNGVVTATLPEPGWWCVTAQCSGAVKERNGKSYPVRQRATLWVNVDERPSSQQK